MKTQFTDKDRRTEAAAKAAKALLPRRDFKAMMEHDKTYYLAIQQEFDYKSIKLDVLTRQVKPIIESQNAKEVSDNINDICEFAQIKRELYDLKGKLLSQAKLIEDKQNHYDYVFLPQYEKELKECKENFKTTLKKIKEIARVKLFGKELKEIISKMLFEIEMYESLDKKQRDNEERKLNSYKPMKRLIAAYSKKVEEMEEKKKYA
tara:strand:+ start:5815 stop:6432 length:618 start_codon:yes stop_codon:yes gene_type:complete